MTGPAWEKKEDEERTREGKERNVRLMTACLRKRGVSVCRGMKG